MFCTNCGAKAGDNEKFCTNCGTRLAVEPVVPVYTPQPEPVVPVYTPEPEPIVPVYTPEPEPVVPVYTPEPEPVTPVYTPEPEPVEPVYVPEPEVEEPVEEPELPKESKACCEYKVVSCALVDLEQELNACAKEGWYVITCDPSQTGYYVAVLEREV